MQDFPPFLFLLESKHTRNESELLVLLGMLKLFSVVLLFIRFENRLFASNSPEYRSTDKQVVRTPLFRWLAAVVGVALVSHLFINKYEK